MAGEPEVTATEGAAPAAKTDPVEAAVAALEEATKGDAPPGAAEKAPAEKPPSPEPTEEQKLAPKIAELARKDRAMRAREAAMREQEKALREHQQLVASIKEDPIGTLLQMGVDMQQVLASLSEGEEQAKQRAQRDPEIEELKQWKAQVEAERQHHQRAGLYRNELGKIKSIVEKDPDQFEAILDGVDDGSLDDVFRAVDYLYQQTGEMPTAETYAEAARLVEQQYQQRETSRIEKWARSKRHAGRLQLVDQGSVKAPADKAASPKKPATTKTLTQDLQREAAPRSKPLTEEERVALAVKIAKEHDFKL